jgi:hypothetical protein
MKGNCTICGVYGVMDRAHIKTRGSGAKWNDSEWMLLCRGHHVMQGAKGWKAMCDLFPNLEEELTKRGWEFIELNGIWKLRRK